jgi:hypothetical protein
MIVYKKKSLTLVLLILIIIFAINTNFFRNLTEIFLYRFDDRIKNRYGFCSNESIGYLFYLKKKYEIKDNPKIVNYAHTPNVNWAIINTKIIDKNSKEFILLNYPGPKYKISLKMINNNIFEPNDIIFFNDKFDKIIGIEILNNSKDIKKINWKLDVVSIDISGNEKIVKKFNIENSLDESLKIKLDILNENLNLYEKKLYFKIKNKNISKIEDLQIKLVMKNKYILEEFQIIDKADNCYYIKKI